jgi:hypothetical protein
MTDQRSKQPTDNIASTVKKPFGKAKYSPVKHARYLDWKDAFDVEFDDGLSFLEPHNAIKKANKISPGAVPVRVSCPEEVPLAL